MNQNHYVHQIKGLPVDKNAKHSLVLDAKGQHEFHSIVGALGWLTNTRTDAMIKISALQSQLGKATIRDVQVANTLIKWLYKHDLTIKYPKIQSPFKCRYKDNQLPQEIELDLEDM